MALGQNYALKYSGKVDEKFKLGALTNGLVNNDYDWLGVSTVKVYSIPTVGLNDYDMNGGFSRYGTPDDLQNDVQELTITQDKSFTFTIDRKEYDDAMMVMEAGKALARQIDEVVVPTVDAYRISKIVAGAPEGNVITKTTEGAYEAFLKVQTVLSNKKAPLQGRVCVGSYDYYAQIKQDSSFTKSGDLATAISMNGVVGTIDGVPFIPVPSSYLPEDVDFVITNAMTTVAPFKLQEYKVHDNVPGISGWLVEGRVRFDTFVLKNKADAIGVFKAK